MLTCSAHYFTPRTMNLHDIESDGTSIVGCYVQVTLHGTSKVVGWCVQVTLHGTSKVVGCCVQVTLHGTSQVVGCCVQVILHGTSQVVGCCVQVTLHGTCGGKLSVQSLKVTSIRLQNTTPAVFPLQITTCCAYMPQAPTSLQDTFDLSHTINQQLLQRRKCFHSPHLPPDTLFRGMHVRNA